MKRVLICLAVGLSACAPEEITSDKTQNPPPTPVSKIEAPLRAAELTGGSLAVGADGHTVAVADADHQQVFLYDTAADKLLGSVDLPGLPGRIVAVPDGSYRVALRSTGEVVRVGPSLNLSVRYACPEPRGLTWDSRQGALWVACAGGELMRLGSDGSTSRVALAGEGLRDVVVTPDGVQVTAFRSGQIYTVIGGQLSAPVPLPQVAMPGTGLTPTWTPGSAWRAISWGNGYVMVHQRAFDGHDGELTPPTPGDTPTTSAPYGSSSVLPTGEPCSSPVVRSVITTGSGSAISASMEVKGVLPVDVAVSPDGKLLAIALAGSQQVKLLAISALGGVTGGDSCQLSGPVNLTLNTPGSPDGVGFLADGRLVTHVVRDGAHVLQIDPALPGSPQASESAFLGKEVHPVEASSRDTFHHAVNEMACASCHPEGHDDGHVWNLIAHTARTQSLAGGLLATAPFHWNGQLNDVGAVMSETFVHRMGGAMPTPAQVGALGKWLDGIGPVQRVSPESGELIARGEELFNSQAVGCTICHAAPTFTNNVTLDVGTGGGFQVPSLRGVAERGPWMHDGCAQTLKQRFTDPACGGTLHGNVSGLADADLDALVAYLETL